MGSVEDLNVSRSTVGGWRTSGEAGEVCPWAGRRLLTCLSDWGSGVSSALSDSTPLTPQLLWSDCLVS